MESHVKGWERGKSDEKRLIWTRDIDAFRVPLSQENKGLASFVVVPKPFVDDVCVRIICFPNYRRGNRITMRGIQKFVVRGICGSFILDSRQFFRKIDRTRNFKVKFLFIFEAFDVQIIWNEKVRTNQRSLYISSELGTQVQGGIEFKLREKTIFPRRIIRFLPYCNSSINDLVDFYFAKNQETAFSW